jgi:hypothetical protein
MYPGFWKLYLAVAVAITALIWLGVVLHVVGPASR